MKFTKTIIGLLALLALSVIPAKALPNAVGGFALGSTNPATTLSYAIISGRTPVQGSAPKITYLNVGSDLATSKVQFYTVTAQTACRYATNATVTLSVSSTNGFASGDVVIIRHYLNDTYEKRILTTMTASTNLILTAAPVASVIPGDTIYRATTAGAGFIPLGATTNAIGPSSGGIYVGQADTPLLLEVNATSTAGQISVVSGEYIQ
jgi:hypothetical protein